MKENIMKKVLILTVLLGIVISGFTQQKSLESYINESQTLVDEAKYQQAVDLMKEAIQVHVDVPEAHFQYAQTWGQWLERTNDMGVAMAAMPEVFSGFSKAIELNPDYFEAHLTKGIWCVMVPIFLGKFNEGVGHLEKALELSDAMENQSDYLPTLYRYLGKGYQMQGRLDDAQTAFEKVLGLTSEGELAEAAKAGLQGIERDRLAAMPKEGIQPKKESAEIVALKKNLESSPEDFDLLMTLSRKYYDEENFPEATAYAKKAVTLKPEDAPTQFHLAMCVLMDAAQDYDERIYKDTNLRTGLAFECAQQLERAYELDPNNPEYALAYAISCIQMPFFVGRIDKGLALLEGMAKDENLSDEIRTEAIYQLGYGYRKKGNAWWMKLAKDFPNSVHMDSIFAEYGLREQGTKRIHKVKGDKVVVTFHLGFMDELPPQTAVWIEDANEKFVKTLYISGFSGYAKEVQVNLPQWSERTQFETDGTTAASIDWGKHTYVWDLTDRDGNRVKDGNYKVHVEVSWWPSMKYGSATADIPIGSSGSDVSVQKEPYIPIMQVQYIKQ
jgi:tetratricopeptide (TPR) repeat protein